MSDSINIDDQAFFMLPPMKSKIVREAEKLYEYLHIQQYMDIHLEPTQVLETVEQVQRTMWDISRVQGDFYYAVNPRMT